MLVMLVSLTLNIEIKPISLYAQIPVSNSAAFVLIKANTGSHFFVMLLLKGEVCKISNAFS